MVREKGKFKWLTAVLALAVVVAAGAGLPGSPPSWGCCC
jgi:hypothetical protein